MLMKETLWVRLLGLRIPGLLFCSPRVLELDAEGCAVGIPLGWRTKNHLGSMYFAVLRNSVLGDWKPPVVEHGMLAATSRH